MGKARPAQPLPGPPPQDGPAGAVPVPWEGRIHRKTGTCLAQSLPTPLVTEVAIPEVVLADGTEQGTSSSPGMLDWARRAGTPPTTATAQGPSAAQIQNICQPGSASLEQNGAAPLGKKFLRTEASLLYHQNLDMNQLVLRS